MTNRHISWFSCGAASAVATKLAKEIYPVLTVARCIVTNEHEDNNRFADDVATWLDMPVLELRSKKYTDCWQVWEERRFLNGPLGALCTVEMKKKVRQDFQQPGDVQIFGYTAGERERASRFVENNPEVNAVFPLIDQGVEKEDCFRIIKDANIELPMMYRLGYRNANCIGCVKGGMGYWNKIRKDFPDVFERMAKLEETIGATCIKGKSLRELLPHEGRHTDLDLGDCGLFCGDNSGWTQMSVFSLGG